MARSEGQAFHGRCGSVRLCSGARPSFSASTGTRRDASIGASVSRFAVKGVPSARGLDVRGSGQVGYNVDPDGPYLYLVGEGWAIGDKNPTHPLGLVSAVKKLYERVHGHTAG